jgi:hypothetical protein
VAKNLMVERKMVELNDVDLRADPDAASYIKTEVVDVQFALQDGELLSLEGPNRYRAGDALVSAQGGNRWSVARERFEHKYQPVPPTAMGQDGAYQARPIPVLAKRIEHAFSIPRCAGGDRRQGKPGDWLLQYAPGDFGLAAQSRFAQVYRKAG